MQNVVTILKNILSYIILAEIARSVTRKIGVSKKYDLCLQIQGLHWLKSRELTYKTFLVQKIIRYKFRLQAKLRKVF